VAGLGWELGVWDRKAPLTSRCLLTRSAHASGRSWTTSSTQFDWKGRGRESKSFCFSFSATFKVQVSIKWYVRNENLESMVLKGWAKFGWHIKYALNLQ
jgi:hypothetical protein